MKYKEIPVYVVASVGVYCDVFVCEGVARDFAGKRPVVQSRVLYATHHPPVDTETIWSVKNVKNNKQTSWYLTLQEAKEAARNMKLGSDEDCMDLSGWYHTRVIQPLEWPQTVCFERDGRGRLFTRINTHPERFGTRAPGKIFFPDKSFEGADVGFATVSINKEFPSYGFLNGEMEKCVSPDLEEFLDWAWERRAPEETVIFINHPGRGRYMMLQCGDGTYRVDEDHIQGIHLSLNCWTDDIGPYTERSAHLVDLYLESAFGVSAEHIKDKFKPFTWMSKKLSTSWTYSDKWYGDLVDKAIQLGILYPYTLTGYAVEALVVQNGNLCMLTKFNEEEVAEIARVVEDVNSLAEKSILSLMRKGKLKVMK